MPAPALSLPAGVAVFERGWLSANSVLLTGPYGTTLVDTGYGSHADATLALLRDALARHGTTLQRIVNTHLHSDHCGGNALLQRQFGSVETLVPTGNYAAARDWDEALLSYRATGQDCPRFVPSSAFAAGDTLALGAAEWQVLAAPGHDNAMLMLFDPISRTLLSADALWANGIGVIFPEIDGEDGFTPMAQTLDVIERLQPQLVIPGHGSPFTDVAAALAIARKRLASFVQEPQRHVQFAAKVLLKFKLLEWQRIHRDALLVWAQDISHLQLLYAQAAAQQPQPFEAWLNGVLTALATSQAAQLDAEGWVVNC